MSTQDRKVDQSRLQRKGLMFMLKDLKLRDSPVDKLTAFMINKENKNEAALKYEEKQS